MTTNPETLRKRKYISNETPKQREARLERERERKRQKRAEETSEQHETRLTGMREWRREKKSNENIEEREMRLNRERRRKRESRARNKENRQVLTQRHINMQQNETTARNQEITQRDNDNSPIHFTPHSATTINGEEHRILQNFREKMDNIRYNSCPVCNERIPSMKIVKGMCRRCYTEKSPIKKFSAENNMDPGDVPEELKGLSEIEEMLIAQVFVVMSVYRLRGGQNGYRGNVINFPQDIHEFTK